MLNNRNLMNNCSLKIHIFINNYDHFMIKCYKFIIYFIFILLNIKYLNVSLNFK